MPYTASVHDASNRTRGLGGVRSAVVFLGMLLASGASPTAGQDPVSGRWFATVEDAVGPARAVFVLEARGEQVRGRLILRGSEGLEVQGRREGQRVRLEFEVPEGRSAVQVVIEAEAFQDQMTGTWRAVLPSGQQVKRSWRAERTRSGSRPGG